MKSWQRPQIWNKFQLGESWRSALAALIVFVSRLGFLPPNFSPVGSVGFFSKSLWPLLLVTLGFDWWRGGFYAGFWWTYLGFAAYWLMGRLAAGRLRRQLLFLPLASLAFFLLSNFGVWLYWYPRTLEGLITCYTLALPFLRNTLMGDVVFGWGWMVIKKLSKIKLQSIRKTNVVTKFELNYSS